MRPINLSIAQSHQDFLELNAHQPDLEFGSYVSLLKNKEPHFEYKYRSEDLFETELFSNTGYLSKKIALRLSHIGFFVYRDEISCFNFSKDRLESFKTKDALDIFNKVVIFVKSEKQRHSDYPPEHEFNNKSEYIAFDRQSKLFYKLTTPSIAACVNPVWEAVKHLLPVVSEICVAPYLNKLGRIVTTKGIDEDGVYLIKDCADSTPFVESLEEMPEIIDRYFINGLFKNVNVAKGGCGMLGVVASALGCCAWNYDMRGRKPLLYICSDERGAGKSTLSMIFRKLTGAVRSNFGTISYKSDSQFDREFLSYLLQKPAYLELANIDEDLDNCDKLANYITDGFVGGKRTGERDSETAFSNAIVSVTAAERLPKGADFERRTLIIKLDKPTKWGVQDHLPSDEEIEEARLWGLACIECLLREGLRKDNDTPMFNTFFGWSQICLKIGLMCGLEDRITTTNLVKEEFDNSREESLCNVFNTLKRFFGDDSFHTRTIIGKLFERDDNNKKLFSDDFVQDLKISCGVDISYKGILTSNIVGKTLNRYGEKFNLMILRFKSHSKSTEYKFKNTDSTPPRDDLAKEDDPPILPEKKQEQTSPERQKTDKSNLNTSRTRVNEFLEANNIRQVVSQHLSLKPIGNGEFRGLCPFHKERTPSFDVNEKKGLFLCRGCGASGDVISFLMKYHGKGFREALGMDELSNLSEKARNVESNDREVASDDIKSDEHLKIIKESYCDKDILRKYFINGRLGGQRVKLPENILYHKGKHMIVCPIEDFKNGEIIGCHRLFLNKDCSDLMRDEHGKRIKRYLGKKKGGIVWLYKGAKTIDNQLQKLYICEGIESGLAAMSLNGYKDGDVVSCLDAGNLEGIEMPKRYKYIVIWCDSDEVGLKAADKLIERIERDNKKFNIYDIRRINVMKVFSKTHKDFCDELNNRF